ncbi:MAG: PHP-associated domain-containing protein [Syntrophales bacterium]|nr:PHP-associated domain-containing protein [Syntrophales bacterium]MDD5532467.1 PHP-associated domain-containing protein [Syntrophales bacterium]
MILKDFRCDLHVHTCLSPCSDLDIYPKALVERSIAEGLDVIAVCDHNSSENVSYVMRAAAGKPLVVFPGMEIATSEEVHVLALFDSVEGLLDVQRAVYDALPGENDEDVFGCQPVVNELDEVEFMNPHLLIGATTIPLGEMVERIGGAGGLAIAAHIDRESFSVFGQLGFIPEGIRFDALEVSARTPISDCRRNFAGISGYALIRSSDAHRLGDLGSAYTTIRMKEPSLSELKAALKGEKGRKVVDAFP